MLLSLNNNSKKNLSYDWGEEEVVLCLHLWNAVGLFFASSAQGQVKIKSGHKGDCERSQEKKD